MTTCIVILYTIKVLSGKTFTFCELCTKGIGDSVTSETRASPLCNYRTRIKFCGFCGMHLIHKNSTTNSHSPMHTQNLIHLHCQTTKI